MIEGHTDSTGGEEHNQDLSERRAQAVAAYMVEHGIDARRTDTVGMGESDETGGWNGRTLLECLCADTLAPTKEGDMMEKEIKGKPAMKAKRTFLKVGT